MEASDLINPDRLRELVRKHECDSVVLYRVRKIGEAEGWNDHHIMLAQVVAMAEREKQLLDHLLKLDSETEERSVIVQQFSRDPKLT